TPATRLRARLPNREREASTLFASPQILRGIIWRSSRNLSATERTRCSQLVYPSAASNHQCTLPLDPAGPGEKVPWSGIFSPPTVPPLCELDSSMVASSCEAHAETRNAIAKSKTAYDAKREIIGTNLTTGIFDASRGIR